MEIDDLNAISCCNCGTLPDQVIFPCGHFVCRKCEHISTCVTCSRKVCLLKDTSSLTWYRKVVSEGSLHPCNNESPSTGKGTASGKSGESNILCSGSSSHKRKKVEKIPSNKNYDPNLTPCSTQASYKLRGSFTKPLRPTPLKESSAVSDPSSKKIENTTVSGFVTPNRNSALSRPAKKTKDEPAVGHKMTVDSKASNKKPPLSRSKSLNSVPKATTDDNEIVYIGEPRSKRRKLVVSNPAPTRLPPRLKKRRIDTSDDDDIFIDSAHGETKSNVIEVIAEVHANPCCSSGSILGDSQEKRQSTNNNEISPILDGFPSFEEPGNDIKNEIDAQDESVLDISCNSNSLNTSTSKSGPENALPHTQFPLNSISSSPDTSYIKSSMTPMEGIVDVQKLNIPKLTHLRNRRVQLKSLRGRQERHVQAENCSRVSKNDNSCTINHSASGVMDKPHSMQRPGKIKLAKSINRHPSSPKLSIGEKCSLCSQGAKAECHCNQFSASQEKVVSSLDCVLKRKTVGPLLAQNMKSIIIPLSRVPYQEPDSQLKSISKDCVDVQITNSKEEMTLDPIKVAKSSSVDDCTDNQRLKTLTISLIQDPNTQCSDESDREASVEKPIDTMVNENSFKSSIEEQAEILRVSSSCEDTAQQSSHQEPFRENLSDNVKEDTVSSDCVLMAAKKITSKQLSCPSYIVDRTIVKSPDPPRQLSPNGYSSSNPDKLLTYSQLRNVFVNLFKKVYCNENPKSLSRLALEVLLQPMKDEQLFEGLNAVSPVTESAEKSAQLDVFLAQTTVKVDIGQDPTKRNSLIRRQLSFGDKSSTPSKRENIDPEVESEDIVECTPTKFNPVRVNLLNDSACSPLSRTNGSVAHSPASGGCQDQVDRVGDVIPFLPVKNCALPLRNVTYSLKMVNTPDHQKTQLPLEEISPQTFHGRLLSSKPNGQQLAIASHHNGKSESVDELQKPGCTSTKLNVVQVDPLTNFMCSPLRQTKRHNDSLVSYNLGGDDHSIPSTLLSQSKEVDPFHRLENLAHQNKTISCSTPKCNKTVKNPELPVAYPNENMRPKLSQCPPERFRLLNSSLKGHLLVNNLTHNDSESIIGESEQFQGKKKTSLALPLIANNLPWPVEDVQEKYINPHLFRDTTNTLVITTSGIYDRQQILAVHKLCSLIRATHGKEVTQETTHLIIPSGDVTLTTKFLMALYIGSYILPFNWVIDCLKSESILSETKYIPNHPGIQKRMILPRQVSLFDNYAFYISQEVRQEDDVNYNALKKLMEFCGCKIVDTFRDIIPAASRYNAVILRHANYESAAAQSGIVQVSYQWFYACLTSYQIQPMDKPT